jgi:hypothetical protein
MSSPIFPLLHLTRGTSLVTNHSIEYGEQFHRGESLRNLFFGWIEYSRNNSLRESVIEDSDQGENADLRRELIRKLLNEEFEKALEKEKEFRQKADTEISKVQNVNNTKSEESESANQDAIKYRILGSLVLFGILEIFDVLEAILKNFEALEKFEEAVAKIVGSKDVLGALGTVNDVLEIDKVAGWLSEFPILNDLNQFFLDLAKSEYVKPLLETACHALGTDSAEFALKGIILIGMIKTELELNKQDNKNVEEVRKNIDKLESQIMQIFDEGVRKSVSASIDYDTKEALRSIDFKVLQDYREGSNIPLELENDLKKCKLFDKIEISAYDLLDKIKFNDADFSEILRRQPSRKINELTKIVEKNSDTLDGLTQVNYSKSRGKLLSRLIENIDIKSIKFTIDDMGYNAITSGALEGCKNKKEYSDESYKSSIVDEVLKLDRESADKIIFVLANHINNVNDRVAEIKARDRSNKGEGVDKAPMDSVVPIPPSTDPSMGRMPPATNLVSNMNYGPQAAGVFPPNSALAPAIKGH